MDFPNSRLPFRVPGRHPIVVRARQWTTLHFLKTSSLTCWDAQVGECRGPRGGRCACGSKADQHATDTSPDVSR